MFMWIAEAPRWTAAAGVLYDQHKGPYASLIGKFIGPRWGDATALRVAALIDAQGLLHNLVVTEQVVGRGKARKVRFAVAAGERRHRSRALARLAVAERHHDDHGHRAPIGDEVVHDEVRVPLHAPRRFILAPAVLKV